MFWLMSFSWFNWRFCCFCCVSEWVCKYDWQSYDFHYLPLIWCYSLWILSSTSPTHKQNCFCSLSFLSTGSFCKWARMLFCFSTFESFHFASAESLTHLFCPFLSKLCFCQGNIFCPWLCDLKKKQFIWGMFSTCLWWPCEKV